MIAPPVVDEIYTERKYQTRAPQKGQANIKKSSQPIAGSQDKLVVANTR